MTRDPITDPEVLADLRKRDATARERADRRGPAGLAVGQDPDGLAPAVAKLYDSKPDPVVEHWPCRKGCGAMVGVTALAVERLAQSNRMLARGERPIGKHEVMWCERCRRADDEERAAARRPHEQLTIGETDGRATGLHDDPTSKRRGTR